jgi:hypothetical protein
VAVPAGIVDGGITPPIARISWNAVRHAISHNVQMPFSRGQMQGGAVVVIALVERDALRNQGDYDHRTAARSPRLAAQINSSVLVDSYPPPIG